MTNSVLMLALAGNAPAFIARQLGISIRSVQRCIARLRAAGALPRDWRPTRE